MCVYARTGQAWTDQMNSILKEFKASAKDVSKLSFTEISFTSWKLFDMAFHFNENVLFGSHYIERDKSTGKMYAREEVWKFVWK